MMNLVLPEGLRRGWGHHGGAVVAVGALVLGVMGYWAWPVEPAAMWGLVGLAGVLVVWPIVAGQWPHKWLLLVVMGLLGWNVAQVHTQWRLQHGADWARAGQVHWVRGVVETVERDERRVKLGLDRVQHYGVGDGMGDALTLSVDAGRGGELKVGQAVAAQVQLMVPDNAGGPRRGDWRLQGWFSPRDLRGWVQGEILGDAGVGLPPARGDWRDAINAWRAEVVAATKHVAGGVVAAMLVGEQRAVEAAVWEDYRRSGLAHLLAISGMQLTAVGVGVWWALRHGMALWPALALRLPIKQLAAVGAVGAATAYMLVAGAGVSVVRAWVMVLLVLVAALLGRGRSGLRAWAVALGGITVLAPWLLLTPGLQLSFGATLALLLWHAGRPVLPPWQRGWGERVKVAVEVTWVAGLATLPLVLYHFGTVNVLGVLANMVAVPMSWVATWLAFGTLLLWPVGLEQAGLVPLGWWLGGLNALAAWVSAWPVASVRVEGVWVWAVGALAVGSVALALLRRWGWSVGVGTLALLVALGAAQTVRPAVWVLEGGKTAVWVAGDEVRLLWGSAAAVRWELGKTTVLGVPLVATCDAVGCGYDTPLGRVVRLEGAPAAEDCALAGMIVAEGGGGACPDKTVGEVAWAMWDGGKVKQMQRKCGRVWQNCRL